jgi:hypothetical protein
MAADYTVSRLMLEIFTLFIYETTRKLRRICIAQICGSGLYNLRHTVIRVYAGVLCLVEFVGLAKKSYVH